MNKKQKEIERLKRKLNGINLTVKIYRMAANLMREHNLGVAKAVEVFLTMPDFIADRLRDKLALKTPQSRKGLLRETRRLSVGMRDTFGRMVHLDSDPEAAPTLQAALRRVAEVSEAEGATLEQRIAQLQAK